MNKRGNQEWLKHLDLYIMVDKAIEHHEFRKLLGLKIGALLFGIGEFLKQHPILSQK